MKPCSMCSKDFSPNQFHKCESRKFLNNSVCKVCYSFPGHLSSLYKGKCSECLIFNRESLNFSRSHSLKYPSNQDNLLLSEESLETFNLDMELINDRLNKAKQNLEDYKTKLKNIVADVIKERELQLDQYEDSIENQLALCRKDITNEMHMLHPNLSNKNGRTIQRLIKKSNIPIQKLIKSLFSPQNLEKLVKDSYHQEMIPIDELLTEPILIHFSTLAKGRMLKVHTLSKKTVPVALHFPLSDSKDWKAGSCFIEILNDKYIYSGYSRYGR